MEGKSNAKVTVGSDLVGAEKQCWHGVPSAVQSYVYSAVTGINTVAHNKGRVPKTIIENYKGAYDTYQGVYITDVASGVCVLFNPFTDAITVVSDAPTATASNITCPSRNILDNHYFNAYQFIAIWE